MGALPPWAHRRSKSPGRLLVLNRFSRIVLFLSSYLPLFLVFGILYLEKHWQYSVGIWIGCIVIFCILRLMLAHVQSMHGVPLTITKSARKDSDTLSYLATYLIPFALAPPQNGYSLAALIVFFLVLGYLYVNSNMIYINPTLSLSGYHLFEVTIGSKGRTRILLARDNDELPSTVNAVELSRGLFMEV